METALITLIISTIIFGTIAYIVIKLSHDNVSDLPSPNGYEYRTTKESMVDCSIDSVDWKHKGYIEFMNSKLELAEFVKKRCSDKLYEQVLYDLYKLSICTNIHLDNNSLRFNTNSHPLIFTAELYSTFMVVSMGEFEQRVDYDQFGIIVIKHIINASNTSYDNIIETIISIMTTEIEKCLYDPKYNLPLPFNTTHSIHPKSYEYNNGHIILTIYADNNRSDNPSGGLCLAISTKDGYLKTKTLIESLDRFWDHGLIFYKYETSTDLFNECVRKAKDIVMTTLHDFLNDILNKQKKGLNK